MKESRFQKALKREESRTTSPILEELGKGIYKAITVIENPRANPPAPFIDPTGRGRLAAYIPALGGNPFDPMFFEYASPFGGIVKEGNYGFFGVPVGEAVTILVFFADGGKATEGYWFAVAQDIPDIVSGGTSGIAKVTGDGQGEGVFEKVAASKTPSRTLGEAVATREKEQENNPRNKVLADQGTYSDTLRGTSTSSPKRDAGYDIPQENKVTGFKTPGGSSLTIDDGSIADNGTIHPEQIRITTVSGATVILDGGNDFIYAVNSSGSGWVEIGAGGEVMVYAEGSLSMRTEKDFNLRADKNVNIEAGENIHMHSIGNTKINSDKEIHLRSKGNQFLQSESGMNINVGVNCIVTTGGKLHLNGPIASESELILVDTMPDIQELETTEVKDTIVSAMPTHEPLIRTQAKELKETASLFSISTASEKGLDKAGIKK
jgi:hypothetical protein